MLVKVVQKKQETNSRTPKRILKNKKNLKCSITKYSKATPSYK